MYIKQKNANIYVCNVEGFEDDLENHPSIVNYPDHFEIVDGEPPNTFGRLVFVMEE